MFQSFMDWLSNPLDTTSGKPSGFRLFLFIGLIIVLLTVWGIIFRYIREAI